MNVDKLARDCADAGAKAALEALAGTIRIFQQQGHATINCTYLIELIERCAENVDKT